MGSEIDKKLDTSNENDESLTCVIKKQVALSTCMNSEIHSQSTLSHKIHSHTEADDDCGRAENECPSWVI